jgi:site-specific DNA-methyltransferase (adenine-specific)
MEDKFKIINGDCLEELPKLPEKSIDVIITSPPYNIGKDYNYYKDNLPYNDYLNWMGKVFEQLYKVLKDNGSFFLNIGGTCKNPLLPFDVAKKAVEKKFYLQNDITWVKSISIEKKDKCESHGHFKPINSDRFLNQQHESIFHFTKDGNLKINRLGIGVPYQDESNISRWKHENKEEKINKRCRGNVWYIQYETVQEKKKHTAAYPIKLPEYCILLHGLSPNLAVLDPFLGGGSTLQACKKLGVKGIGIEIDQHYCLLSKSNLT